MRSNVLRTLADNLAGGASSGGAVNRGQDNIAKLVWATWHKELGKLAMDVMGAESLTAQAAPYELDEWQRLFLFTRSDTIYGGSDEIQRNILAERVLGLPREARP